MFAITHAVYQRRAAILAFAVAAMLAGLGTSIAGASPAVKNHPSQIRLAQADSPRTAHDGILAEARLGLMAHDVGVFGTSKEDGVDIDLDVLFVSPKLLEAILSPEPELGITLNTQGDTSQLYGGLAWDWTFWDPFFVEGTLGLSLHDGELSKSKPDRKDLGCRVLFRESASLGLQFLERHRLMLALAHISNAALCDNNGGLDTVGVRYGFKF